VKQMKLFGPKLISSFLPGYRRSIKPSINRKEKRR